jgi:hypothetical protein
VYLFLVLGYILKVLVYLFLVLQYVLKVLESFLGVLVYILEVLVYIFDVSGPPEPQHQKNRVRIQKTA